MLPAARMMDMTIGTDVTPTIPVVTTGFILPSQFTVLINGLPAATLCDMVLSPLGGICIIVSGSPNVFITGLPAATMGSVFVGTYSGTVIGGSYNVFC